jgi:YVTN family beta-propeller protein
MMHRPSRFALLTCVGVVTLAALQWLSSLADINVPADPLSQGRPLTPVGSLVVDLTTRQPAVGALPARFIRSPDTTGPGGGGRYLLVANSGYGIQFNAATNSAQQSLAVIDLKAQPAPAVVQNIYFPSPQSVNVGLVFAPKAGADGTYALYASGGVENKVWVFRFTPGAREPVTPASPGPDTKVTAPFIDVSGFTNAAPVSHYNSGYAPIYPVGLAINPDGNTLFVANNLGDSLGIVGDLGGARTIAKVDLRGPNREQFVYPYDVVAVRAPNSSSAEKVFVSCWNDASVAVVEAGKPEGPVRRIAVARHPTAMIPNRLHTRLYVVNSNADSVSVIDTVAEREIERIDVRLAEGELIGGSPEGLALGEDGGTLYVANAHSNALAVVSLSAEAAGVEVEPAGAGEREERSLVRGFIPTGRYPSAVAVVNQTLFVGNGKGTGFENSSVVVDNSGHAPNVANDRFPAGARRGGQYILSLVSGNIAAVALPDGPTLARYTQQVMRNNGLLGRTDAKLFKGRSPIQHIIYVIKENRTYDQVFGDLARSGDGRPADGDPSLAIFGSGEAARRPDGTAQDVTPNHRALALRFGLLDRFFVNSEASPDGHNWSTAAFSSDYVDKAYRWDYSGRGRTYDYEGFNRLPSYEPPSNLPPVFRLPVSGEDVANYMRKFIPYLNNSRDVAEPESLYLWDAAARANLTYRNYGEFVGTVSEADVAAINARRSKVYPDVSPTRAAVPTKKTLEGHSSATFRSYDLFTPDAMTTDSYRAARESGERVDPAVGREHADERFRGTSRFGEWLAEFQGYVAALEAGGQDRLPNLTILRFVANHTAGLSAGMPTPQFMVADNDYALGRLVEAVSHSPYWKNTAIFVLEDDAQDGPDHVDAHRSPALVISAYNRSGALVREFHTTVSLIRTMELLIGLRPMNQLDAAAAPIDVFGERADLSPYKAVLPTIALDNLITPRARDAATAFWMKRTAEQDLAHADMADPRVLNEVIWFSVRGGDAPMPEVARLPAFDALRTGIAEDADDDDEPEQIGKRMGTGPRR